MAKISYWKGFKVRYTGISEIIHGGLFYQIILLEGPDKGKIRWTTWEPK
jgi:hypothetical protein